MVNFKNVGIVGAGTIGAGWAAFYACKGMNVRLIDTNEELARRGVARAGEFIDNLARFDLIERTVAGEAKSRVSPVANWKALVADIDFVHESALEEYGVKKEVFSTLDRLTPETTIIASSSSGLLMTEMQKVMRRPERALIAHPFNPPHLIPLVELVPGEQTEPDLVTKMFDFFTGLGKIPVVLKKEVPGHIANRLSAALWREALDLVSRGVASVKDVDRALYAGPGIRWSFMGPHMIYHLGGGEGGYEYFIEHIGKAFETYWKEMADWSEIPEQAKQLAVAGVRDYAGDREMSDLCRERDKKLAEVLRALYSEAG